MVLAHHFMALVHWQVACMCKNEMFSAVLLRDMDRINFIGQLNSLVFYEQYKNCPVFCLSSTSK